MHKPHGTLDSFRRFLPPVALTHIMYHANCYDGISSAWVSTLFDRRRKEHPTVHVPVRAAQTWPELVASCPELEVTPEALCCLFVDVAPSVHVVAELRRRKVRFGVLDHHKSNERELAIHEAFYNMHRAGCILCYQYFFGEARDAEIPWILLYLED